MKLLRFPHLKLLCLFSLEKERQLCWTRVKNTIILHNARYWIIFRLTSSGDFRTELENIMHLNFLLNSFCKNSSSWCEVLVTWIYFFLPRIVDFTTNQSQTSPGLRMSRNTSSPGQQLTDSLIFYKQKLSSLNSGFNHSFHKCIRALDAMHSMSQCLLQAQVAFSVILKHCLCHKGAWALLDFSLTPTAWAWLWLERTDD